MIRASRVCRGVCKCGLYCRKPQNFGDLTTPSSQQPAAPRDWGADYRHELANTVTAAGADRYVIAVRLHVAT
jgi:hypothetical protein